MKNNIFHCGITRGSTTMFNNLFHKHYKYPFEYDHHHSNCFIENQTDDKFIVPPKSIITHIINIKYSDFFDKLSMETEDIKGFYVCRDPRDVVVSAYWSILKSHPGGHPEREKVKELTKTSKIQAMNYITDIYKEKFDVMYDWVVNCKDERFLIIKFEDMFKSEKIQIDTMVDLFKFLEIDRDEDEMREIFNKYCVFSSGACGGRRAGHRIINTHHYRSGISTYKEEMPSKSLKYMYKTRGEDFFTDMGYQI